MTDAPMKREDYFIAMEKSKTYEEWSKWADALCDYMKRIKENERGLSRHLGVYVRFCDI